MRWRRGNGRALYGRPGDGAPPPVAPMLDGLALWLRASDIVPVSQPPYEAGQVEGLARWPDSSGLGNDAKQSTPANQPTLHLAPVGVGGGPFGSGVRYVSFDRTRPDLLAVPYSSSYDASPEGLTVLVVMAGPADDTNDDFLARWSSASVQQESWILRHSSNEKLVIVSRHDSSTLFSATTVSEVADGTMRLAEFRVSAGGLAIARVDGGAEASTAMPGALQNPTTEGIGIGARFDGSQPATVDIAEVLLYTRDLAAVPSDYAAVRAYLAAQYGGAWT